MGLKAMDYCVTVVAFEQNGKQKGMACAWAMQVDYDKLLCLLGAQSDTGNSIFKGDIIGVSVLDQNQKELAIHFGEGHSNQVDKFKNVDIHKNGTAITLPNASREFVCKVLDVLHLEKIESDNLLYLEIVSVKENGDHFLHYSEL